VNVSIVEVIDASRGCDLQIRLRKCWDGYGGASRLSTHQPIGLAVNFDQADQWLRRARPFARYIVGQVVRLRPDAEKWVVHDQWYGRRSKRGQVCARLQGLDIGAIHSSSTTHRKLLTQNSYSSILPSRQSNVDVLSAACLMAVDGDHIFAGL